LVLTRSRALEFHCGDLLRETLAAHGLRGGGGADLAQADVPKEELETVRMELEASIRSRCGLPHRHADVEPVTPEQVDQPERRTGEDDILSESHPR
jgi:hypothetical protein